MKTERTKTAEDRIEAARKLIAEKIKLCDGKKNHFCDSFGCGTLMEIDLVLRGDL